MARRQFFGVSFLKRGRKETKLQNLSRRCHSKHQTTSRLRKKVTLKASKAMKLRWSFESETFSCPPHKKSQVRGGFGFVFYALVRISKTWLQSLASSVSLWRIIIIPVEIISCEMERELHRSDCVGEKTKFPIPMGNIPRSEIDILETFTSGIQATILSFPSTDFPCLSPDTLTKIVKWKRWIGEWKMELRRTFGCLCLVDPPFRVRVIECWKIE